MQHLNSTARSFTDYLGYLIEFLIIGLGGLIIIVFFFAIASALWALVIFAVFSIAHAIDHSIAPWTFVRSGAYGFILTCALAFLKYAFRFVGKKNK